MKNLLCRLSYCALTVIALLCFVRPTMAHAQSSGSYVSVCSSEEIDPNNGVEITVCMNGDATGLTSRTEVDNDYSEMIPLVGAKEYIYDGSASPFYSSVGDPGTFGSETDDTFIPQINTVYMLTGWSDECYDSTAMDNDSTCSWGFNLSSLSIQGQVTPSINLATSNISVPSGTPVTFTASIVGGLTGTIIFYDGTTVIGNSTISNGVATLTTNAVTVGFHTIIAFWPGDLNNSAMTSAAVYQAVFQPGAVQTPAAGVISTVAGNGVASYAGDSGYAMAAELNNIFDVALDSSGNLYIADAGNSRIRKVTASTGFISTVAGNGTTGYSGDEGAATSAKLYFPTGVAVDRTSGDIYIVDEGNDRIRKVTTSGIISTIAGTGTAGYSGDGGPATSAELQWPQQLATDNAGNLYIADTINNRIRKVTATGIISTVAGGGTGEYLGDGGLAINASLDNPSGVAVDGAGNIYISDTSHNLVRKVNASTGTISTIAGNGNGNCGYSGDGGAR